MTKVESKERIKEIAEDQGVVLSDDQIEDVLDKCSDGGFLNEKCVRKCIADIKDRENQRNREIKDPDFMP